MLSKVSVSDFNDKDEKDRISRALPGPGTYVGDKLLSVTGRVINNNSRMRNVPAACFASSPRFAFPSKPIQVNTFRANQLLI